jgi:hypothetical protein
MAPHIFAYLLLLACLLLLLLLQIDGCCVLRVGGGGYFEILRSLEVGPVGVAGFKNGVKV